MQRPSGEEASTDARPAVVSQAPLPGPLHVCSEPDTLVCSLTRPQQGCCLSGTHRRLGAQRLTIAQSPQGSWHLRPVRPGGWQESCRD